MGEYYPSFTGEYGGQWRRQSRPPWMIVGTGFTAQGFDISAPYQRLPDSSHPRAAFIFAGVGKDELIGDFGLIGGGAAGLEIDRADRHLGTPPHALVLATLQGRHTDIDCARPLSRSETVGGIKESADPLTLITAHPSFTPFDKLRGNGSGRVFVGCGRSEILPCPLKGSYSAPYARTRSWHCGDRQ